MSQTRKWVIIRFPGLSFPFCVPDTSFSCSWYVHVDKITAKSFSSHFSTKIVCFRAAVSISTEKHSNALHDPLEKSSPLACCFLEPVQTLPLFLTPSLSSSYGLSGGLCWSSFAYELWLTVVTSYGLCS